LNLVAETIGNDVYQHFIENIASEVATGKNLTSLITASNLFPSLTNQMVAVGETTGSLDKILTRLADYFEKDIESATKNLTTLIEPILIIILGIIIGILVFSIIPPIYNSITSGF